MEAINSSPLTLFKQAGLLALKICNSVLKQKNKDFIKEIERIELNVKLIDKAQMNIEDMELLHLTSQLLYALRFSSQEMHD